jgi:hypothetical protein
MCTAPSKVCPVGTAVDANGTDAASVGVKNTCIFCLKGYYLAAGVNFTAGTTGCTACTTIPLST